MSRQDGTTVVKELWFHSQMRGHHSNVMRIGDYVALTGPNGDFSRHNLCHASISVPAKFSGGSEELPRANTLLVGDRAIILDEDGVLHILAHLSPEGLQLISSFQVLENLSWTPATPSAGHGSTFATGNRSLQSSSKGQSH